MAFKGPLRNPYSRRGEKEMPNFREEAPQAPECPEWLSEEQSKVFTRIVASAVAAGIPVKRADSDAFAMAAKCIERTAYWTKEESSVKSIEEKIDCGRMATRYERDAQVWLRECGGSPMARARMGIRGDKPKGKGTVLQILEAKRQRMAV